VYVTGAIHIVVLGAIGYLQRLQLRKFLKYTEDEIYSRGTSSSETVLPRMIAKLEI